MISIRECVSGLDAIKTRHCDFVEKEVAKRIDFYLSLFSHLKAFHESRNGQFSAFGRKLAQLNTIVLSSQIQPFSKILFKKEPSGDIPIRHWKEYRLFKPEAFNYDEIDKRLRQLKKSIRKILELDLSQGVVSMRYYKILQLQCADIKFLFPRIFDYSWFLTLDPSREWGAYQLTEALGMKVCAYCNRLYTFTLSDGANKVTRPELDHFLPKSLNPMLALSFYNLIPSCTVCNRDCKGKTPMSHEHYISPYDPNAGHAWLKFDYIPTSYLGAIGETDDIQVLVKPATTDPILEARLNKTIDLFHYNTIMHEHRDIVQEIIRRRHISNDTYVESILKAFPKSKLTPDEAYRLAYGNFYKEKEFNRRPMAKLTKDIAIGIGVLKRF